MALLTPARACPATMDPVSTPPADGSAADQFRQDLQMVRTLHVDPVARDAFSRRLGIVPRILAARNARFGRPLRDQELEELSSDVVLIILRKLENYRGLGSFEGFCYRICDLELRNRVRALRRERQRTTEIDESIAARPEPPRDEIVHLALERLGGAEAEVIRLYTFERLDWDAIAELTGTTPANAKSRYYRGTARLGEIIAAARREETGNGERHRREKEERDGTEPT